MPWQYVIDSHTLYRPDGVVESHDGWAGHDAGNLRGMNNPAACSMRGIGPLPPGRYEIGEAISSPHMGPLAIPLDQVSGETYHRSGFFIHGSSMAHPALSSDGCIIQSRSHRGAIDASEDALLDVFATEGDRG